MVAAGMGVTILSDMVYRPWSLEGQRIETRHVIGDIPTMDVGLAWNRKQAQPPTRQSFPRFHDHDVQRRGRVGRALRGTSRRNWGLNPSH